MGYVTLDEAKVWLNVSDDSEDELIVALIEAASNGVDAFCNREIGKGTVTEEYTGNGTQWLFLRRTPIVSISSISVQAYPSATMTTLSSYTFDKTAVRRTDSGTFPYNGIITVTYVGGYDPIPADIKMAMRLTLQALRNSQALDPNLQGENLGGTFGGSYSEFGPGAVPRAARFILNNYIARFTP